MGACACFCDWERVGAKRRKRSKQGGRDWENKWKRVGGGEITTKKRNEWWRHTHITVYTQTPAEMTRIRTSFEWAGWVCGWRDAATVQLIFPSVWSLQPSLRGFLLHYFKSLLKPIEASMMPNPDSLIIITHESLIMTLMIFISLQSVLTCVARGLDIYWCIIQCSIKNGTYLVTHE